MTTDIDFIKMAEQEPEFKAFAQEAMYNMMLHTQSDFMKAMYSFWSIGMTVQQASEWLITNTRLQGPPNDKA